MSDFTEFFDRDELETASMEASDGERPTETRREVRYAPNHFLASYDPSSYYVPHMRTPSETQRENRVAFEDLYFECLGRDSICRKDLRAFGLSSYSQVTGSRPNSRNRHRLRRHLRPDDIARDPYLNWSKQDLMIALNQRKAALPKGGSTSRFHCCMALEKADRERQFRFLDLPKDIRMLVYEHALLQQGSVPTRGGLPPLLCTSKQVRQEADATFFRINRFSIHVGDTTQPFPSRFYRMDKAEVFVLLSNVRES